MTIIIMVTITTIVIKIKIVIIPGRKKLNLQNTVGTILW